jgi:hypothetical protein
MTSVGQSVQQLTLFAIFALVFLGTTHLFLAYRWRRALSRDEARAYVPHADPWLPLLLTLIGTGWTLLLYLLR